MLTATILPNGNLSLQCDESARDDLAYESEQCGYWAALAAGLEGYSCNGGFTPLQNGDYGLVFGLTDSPFIAESLTIDDNGQGETIGRVWYLPDYATRDDMAALIAGKSVEWALLA